MITHYNNNNNLENIINKKSYHILINKNRFDKNKKNKIKIKFYKIVFLIKLSSYDDRTDKVCQFCQFLNYNF